MGLRVHCCWFGPGEMGEAREYCLRTWRERIPDMELMLWNEGNCGKDIEESPYARRSLKDGMYAFTSDYIRLVKLHRFGGVYLDSDVEVIKDVSPLCGGTSLFMESSVHVATGVIIAPPRSPIIKRLVDIYNDGRHGGAYFRGPKILTSLVQDITGEPARTGAFDYMGERVAVLPSEHFYPYNPYDTGDAIHRVPFYGNIKEGTYGIHHWFKSWRLGIAQRMVNRLVEWRRRLRVKGAGA